MPEDIIKSEKLERLATAIQERGGVLFLGPGVATYEDTGMPMIRKYAQKAADLVGLAPDPKDDEEKENLSYIAQKAIREDPRHLDSIKREYADYFSRHLGNKTLYKTLARLNFRLVINTNPDKELYERVKAANQRTAVFGYFDGSNDGLRNAAGGSTMQGMGELSFSNNIWVQYNLLGSFDNHHSIRLCESDFIQLIRTIDAPNQIPAFIRSYVVSGVPLVFLGFNFEHWHYKIVCSYFNIGYRNVHSSQDASTQLSTSVAAANTSEERKPVCIYNEEYPIATQSKRAFFETEFRFSFQRYNLLTYVNSLDHYAGKVKTPAVSGKKEVLLATVLYRETLPEAQNLAERFTKHLSMLSGDKIDTPWTISSITGGGQYSELRRRLLITQVLVVLLSADFHVPGQGGIDYDEEIQSILSDKRNSGLLVVPVVLRDYMYKKYSWLSEKAVLNNIQPVSENRVMPLISIEEGQLDAVIKQVVEFIEKKIDEL